MMPGHEGTPLTADEYLMFTYIVETSTYQSLRTQISSALAHVKLPCSSFVMDAWQRRAEEIWRTASRS
jgi:hypothetical protein